MTDQKSKLEALELTISIIDSMKANVREETFESYLTDRRSFFQEIVDNVKHEKNYVIPRIAFIQAHSVLKAHEDSMSKLLEIYKDSMGFKAFHQYATAKILKSQLWRLYYGPQE